MTKAAICKTHLSTLAQILNEPCCLLGTFVACLSRDGRSGGLIFELLLKCRVSGLWSGATAILELVPMEEQMQGNSVAADEVRYKYCSGIKSARAAKSLY